LSETNFQLSLGWSIGALAPPIPTKIRNGKPKRIGSTVCQTAQTSPTCRTFFTRNSFFDRKTCAKRLHRNDKLGTKNEKISPTLSLDFCAW
jgi:hypothetical protein